MRIKPRTSVSKLTYWHICLIIALTAAYYLPTHMAAMITSFCNFLWMLED